MSERIIPNNIRVGDTVTNLILALGKTLAGTVIYIHPRGRYYRVEYTFKGGKVRESYFA